jgi:hypothetical protein
MRIVRTFLLLAVVAVLAVLLSVFRPAAEETTPGEGSKVTDRELQTVIDVYLAMQKDHDLMIEQAVQPHQMSLDDFRRLERRVQAEQRLVDKVRHALLLQAQGRSVFGEAPTATATPTEVARRATPTPQAKKRSRGR